jgi:hypothetical protein
MACKLSKQQLAERDTLAADLSKKAEALNGQNERNALLVRISGKCNVLWLKYIAITVNCRFALSAE